MTILDILTKGVGVPADKLRALLIAGGEAAPDLKPTADKILDTLERAIEPSNLATVSALVAEELKNIIGGNLDGRDHPSDAA